MYEINAKVKEINQAKKRKLLEYIEKNPAMFGGVDGEKFAKKRKADDAEKLLVEFVDPEKIIKETKKAVYTEMSGWVAKSISFVENGFLVAVEKWKYDDFSFHPYRKCKQYENIKEEKSKAEIKATAPAPATVEIPAAPVPTPEPAPVAPAFELSAPAAPEESSATPTPSKKSTAQNPAERAEIARASHAAAESFVLGGDPLDNLTGQTAFLF